MWKWMMGSKQAWLGKGLQGTEAQDGECLEKILGLSFLIKTNYTQTIPDR